MINSRDLADLHPLVLDKARRLIALCDAAGIDLLITGGNDLAWFKSGRHLA